MPTSSALKAFAQDPPAFLPPQPGATVVDDACFHLTVSPDGRHATACRLRTDDVAGTFRAVRAHAPQARIVWITDGRQEAELRACGCREQDPPLTSYITALATDEPPPEVLGVEVRRIVTFDEYLVGLSVSAAGWGTPPDGDPEESWLRHGERPGGDWLALVDGEPAAYAGAIAGPRGLFLTGGVTRPEARGRGAYRALVRARWDEAVRLGTPALVVHAEEASRVVLERIGFATVGRVVELVAPRVEA